MAFLRACKKEAFTTTELQTDGVVSGARLPLPDGRVSEKHFVRPRYVAGASPNSNPQEMLPVSGLTHSARSLSPA